jgi:hypothetical protein
MVSVREENSRCLLPLCSGVDEKINTTSLRALFKLVKRL